MSARAIVAAVGGAWDRGDDRVRGGGGGAAGGATAAAAPQIF